MGTKKFLIVLCSLFMALSAAAQGNRPVSTDETTLIALEKMWNQAQLTHDSSALKSMITDNFVSTEWDGVISSHDQFLKEIADPKWVPSVMNIQDLKVLFYPQVAIVVGIYHTKGQSNGKPYDHVGRFTDTWIRQDSVWKCVASHTSLIQK